MDSYWTTDTSYDIPIEYIGLRPGEKMFEELIIKGENINESPHEKIMILKKEIKNGWNQTLAESEKVVKSSKSFNLTAVWRIGWIESFNLKALCLIFSFVWRRLPRTSHHAIISRLISK